MEWMLLPLKRYADFSGRSRRKEFWMFQLLYAAIMLLAVILITLGLPDKSGAAPLGVTAYIGIFLLMVTILGLAIPSLAVQARRYHDQDKSGWMVLVAFIPFIGGILQIVFMCMEGTHGANRFGPDPKQAERAG